MAEAFVPYSDSVETIGPEEQETFEKIAASMGHISQMLADRFRHAERSVHAKSHGILKGVLEIDRSLAAPYVQGLFQPGSRYDVLMRLSTTPGDILPDSISTPRGMAVKIFNVPGPTVTGHEHRTQDFVMVNEKVFGAKDAATFFKQAKVLEKHSTDSPSLKQAVSTTARVTEQALEAVGGGNGEVRQFGHPETHILGETFSTILPLRYGDYFGKLAFIPHSENLKALYKKKVDASHNYSILRDEVQKFFATETAVWHVGIQLCTDLEKMPVEDATKQWSEQESPFVPVAMLTVAPQESFSDSRREFVEQRLSFSPWHSVEAHRPLGQMMRARRAAYPRSVALRAHYNATTIVEPEGVAEIPD